MLQLTPTVLNKTKKFKTDGSSWCGPLPGALLQQLYNAGPVVINRSFSDI